MNALTQTARHEPQASFAAARSPCDGARIVDGLLIYGEADFVRIAAHHGAAFAAAVRQTQERELSAIAPRTMREAA